MILFVPAELTVTVKLVIDPAPIPVTGVSKPTAATAWDIAKINNAPAISPQMEVRRIVCSVARLF